MDILLDVLFEVLNHAFRYFNAIGKSILILNRILLDQSNTILSNIQLIICY